MNQTIVSGRTNAVRGATCTLMCSANSTTSSQTHIFDFQPLTTTLMPYAKHQTTFHFYRYHFQIFIKFEILFACSLNTLRLRLII